MVDPPWYERGAGVCKRGADKHYTLIKTVEEIEQVILRSGVFNPDLTGAHLYLWVTNNPLPARHALVGMTFLVIGLDFDM